MEQSAKWYNEVYKISQEYRKEPKDSRYYPIWNKALSLINNERIVDLGCGSGQFAKLLLKNHKKFIYGIDFSIEAISIARELNPKNKLQFFVGDILENLPSSDLYDLVICFEVLEHVALDMILVQRIASNKRFIFSVPNYYYQSHVRKFNSEMDVMSRYSELIDIKSIYPFTMHDKNIIYLVDSVRK